MCAAECMVSSSQFCKIFVFLTIFSLFAPLQFTSSAYADTGRATLDCDTGNWDDGTLKQIENGSCAMLSLGLHPMSTTFEITFDANNEPLDLLIMSDGARLSYQNSQLYRPYIESDPSFENISNSITYRWTTPPSSQAKSWWIVIDNMNHPFDEGFGAQGSNDTNSFTLMTEKITDQWIWTEYDNIVRLSSGSSKNILENNPLIMSEGSQLSITANPVTGDPDIYLMTEEQKAIYDSSIPGVWKIDAIDMRSITSETSDAIVIPPTLEEVPLYVIVDNQANPSGGGDGLTDAAISVKLEITPVLNPIINRDMEGTIDIGQSLTLDASNTPNLRNQISLLSWDMNGDNDLDDGVDIEGPSLWSVSKIFTEIGTHTINLKVNSADGRNITKGIDIQVDDLTNPLAKIKSGNGTRTVSMGDTLILESESTDNHKIVENEWKLDGNKMSSAPNYNVSTTTRGNYAVTLKVIDEAGNSDEIEININVLDSTVPEFESFMIEGFSTYGEWNNPQYKNVMQAGKNIEFTISGSDSDSGPVSYQWDFDISTDSNGDGNSRDDVDAEGAQTSYSYSKGGVYQIGVKIINSDGLVQTHYEYVTISDAPEPPKSMMPMILGGVILVGILVAIGSFVVQNLKVRMKHKAMIAQQLSPEEEEVQRKEEERTKLYGETKGAELDVNDAEVQKQMFAGNAGAQVTNLQAAETEISKIAGMGQELQPTQIDSSLLDGLIEQQESVMSEQKPEQKGVQVPEVIEEKVSDKQKTGLGIELPDMEPQNMQHIEAIDERFEKVRAMCASCEFEFIAEMPENSDRAMVGCPSRNEEMILQR